MTYVTHAIDPKLRTLLDEFASGDFTAESLLADLGMDSLSLVRTVVRYVPDEDQEIDAGALGEVRTVGQLQAWLDSLTTGQPANGSSL
jgi:aryl carrier-like protein